MLRTIALEITDSEAQKLDDQGLDCVSGELVLAAFLEANMGAVLNDLEEFKIGLDARERRGRYFVHNQC